MKRSSTLSMKQLSLDDPAERERRAKVIHAEGELQASEHLAQAAQRMNEEPGAMTLRYLQTLIEIGMEQNTTTIFPVPIDIFAPYLKSQK